MTVKKKTGHKPKKIQVTDISPSPKERSNVKAEKDDPKGGGYNFTPAWPKKY